MTKIEKIFVAKMDIEQYDGCIEDASMSFVGTTPIDVVKGFTDEIATSKEAVEALLKNKHFQQALLSLGYKNIKSLETVSEKIRYNDRFYLAYKSHLTEIESPETLDLAANSYTASGMATGQIILVQEVNDSVFKDTGAPAAAILEKEKRRQRAYRTSYNKTKSRMKESIEKHKEQREKKKLAEAAALLKKHGIEVASKK